MRGSVGDHLNLSAEFDIGDGLFTMRTMRFNSGQKAQQALEELVKPGPWEERLKAAWAHLILAGSREYAEDCQEIVEAFNRGREAIRKNDYQDLSVAIREMIELIFMEEGANETRNKMIS